MSKLFYCLAFAIPCVLLFFVGHINLSLAALCLGATAVLAGSWRETATRKSSLNKALDSSSRDELTGLPNRRLFMDRLHATLASPLKKDGHTAVFFIDLDNFKNINDSLGHTAGDRVLVEVTSRLRHRLPAEHMLARMGGDEMTILVEEISNRAALQALAQKLMESFNHPLSLGGQEVWVNASMGIVMAPMPRPTADDFLAMADTALYNAKSRGKGQFILFEPNLPRPTRRLLSLDADLRSAVQRNEMVLHFQPIVELSTMRVAGFEALIRWKHPRHGLLPPKDFIPLAEESGLIRTMGSWIIEKGCEQIGAWQGLSGLPLTLSINLSVLQFRQKDILSHIASSSARAGLSARSLYLEITESILIQDDPGTAKNLRDLHDLGYGIAVDDFGVGYSSLGYLKNFDVDVLKLDQSFLVDLESPKSKALVRGAIQLGRSLETIVVAEGIETEEQLRFLQDAGCHRGQGYLLGKPMAELQITELLLSGALLGGPSMNEESLRSGPPPYWNVPFPKSA